MLTPKHNPKPEKNERKKQNESQQGESQTENHWHSSRNTYVTVTP